MAILRSDLTKLAGHAGAAAQRALLQTGADIVNILHQPGYTPRDTGNLQDSYGAVPVSSEEVHVGTNVPYGIFVEHGTSRQSAQPHLTPAFLTSPETFAVRLRQELEKLRK